MSDAGAYCGRTFIELRVRDRLIKIGGKIVRHGRYVTFQMAEIAVPRDLFADILSRIKRLRPKPAPV